MARYYNKPKKKHRVLKGILITLLVLIIIFTIIVGSGFIYINSKLNKIQREEIDVTQVGIDKKVSEELKGYRNIAILGIDSRADDYGLGNRSDCMMIASINNKTKDIRLVSIYRDTYVEVEENGVKRLDKLTHAYSYGGAQNALKAINTNLDLNITEFVTVNFDAVIAAVNKLGGVEINIENSELKYINDYITATSKSSGVPSKPVTRAGRQTLDGVQAVAYSRIRYTAGGDAKRTERMRTVVEAMASKAKTLSLSELNSFADEILPRVRTNIKSSEMIAMMPSIASYNIIQSKGWPYKNSDSMISGVYYGVPVTLESNVKELHKELFNQNNYEVSDKVKSVSTQIVNKSGKK